MKNTLTISPRFFQSELKNYACHRSALVREFLQNSVDSAGCSKIDIEYGENWISFKDNGAGMSREILVNKFLCLGETTKNEGGGIGGFGKARALTVYAQESYQIISHDYRVEGIGGDYEIFDNESTRGCFFKIKTKETNWDKYIRQVLSQCSLRQTVTINGETYKSDISRGRWARSLTFGEIWVNKSQKPMVIVRVGGVFMFSLETNAPAQVIIEINPEISREVLLSNRDSLNWKYQSELNAFCRELETEKISALKTKTKKFSQFAKQGKVLYSRKNKVIKLDFQESPSIQREAAFAPTHQNFEKEITLDQSSYTRTYEEESKWYDPAMISLESDDPILVKAAKFFDLSEIDESTTRIKLLKVWKSILEFVTAKYTEKFNHEFAWGFGFVFSEECAAQCKTYSNDIHYLLLNPVGSDGKIKFSINKKESLAELLSLAIHETTHIGANYHDENFASIITTLFADCLKDWSPSIAKLD